MKKLAKVHILHTDDNNSNVIYCQNGRYVKPQKRVHQQAMYNGCTRHYIYITTDDKPKEGDWCVVGEFIEQFSSEFTSDKERDANWKKIIATTDSALHYNTVEGITDGGRGRIFREKNVPQIPQSFIEEYCKVGGIDEIDVEYELKPSLSEGDDYYSWYVTTPKNHSWSCPVQEQPKVTSNNEIIIHSIEEKVYTKKEVEELCKKAFTHYHYNKMTQGHFEIWKQENIK